MTHTTAEFCGDMFMKMMAKALRSDLSRCLCSPPIYMAVLALATMELLGVLSEVRIRYGGTVLSFHSVQGFGVAPVILCAFPFSAAFCVEWRYRYAHYAIHRISPRAYAWSKMLTAAITGVLTVAAGMSLYFLALRVRFPLIERSEYGVYAALVNSMPFGPLLASPHPVLYFVTIVIMESMATVIYASAAMAISAWIPNLFVVLSCPILLFYLLANAVPRTLWHFNPLYIYHNMNADIGGMHITIVFAVVYMMACFLALGFFFELGVKRRMKHE